MSWQNKYVMSHNLTCYANRKILKNCQWHLRETHMCVILKFVVSCDRSWYMLKHCALLFCHVFIFPLTWETRNFHYIPALWSLMLWDFLPQQYNERNYKYKKYVILIYFITYMNNIQQTYCKSISGYYLFSHRLHKKREQEKK